MLKQRWSCLSANFLLMHRGNLLNETQGFLALARCCLADTGDSRTGSTRGSCEITVAGVHCEGITVFPRLTRVVLGWLLEARVLSPFLEDSSASLRCINPTLNIHPDSTASFPKPSHFAYYGDCLSMRAMPNGEGSRLWGIARLRFEINPALHVAGTAMEVFCSRHGSL